MTLPSSGSISMQQIGNEFGFTASPETNLGDYRTLANGSNYPQSIGALYFSSIDGGDQFIFFNQYCFQIMKEMTTC